MTTDEIEYQVDLGHTQVSPGTYFLEVSGNVSPVYAWTWEIDRRADASALALRNQHGVWTNESIVARYGVLSGGEKNPGFKRSARVHRATTRASESKGRWTNPGTVKGSASQLFRVV